MQALRKECRGDNTAKYLQSVRAFDAISEMEPEPNLESIEDYTRIKLKEKNVLPEYSTRNYPLPRNNDVSDNNLKFAGGQNGEKESKLFYGQKVGFEFNNKNENENLYGYRHREEMDVRTSTYAYNDQSYMERMDLVDCTDMNDSSVHSSSLLSNTPAQGREKGRERDREENISYQISQNHYS